MIGLTHEQSRCLDAVRKLSVDGVCPSYAEIAAELGLKSRSGVFRLLNELRERDRIRSLRGKSRSIEIVEPDVPELIISEVRALCQDSAREGFAVSRPEIAARLLRAMGQGA